MNPFSFLFLFLSAAGELASRQHHIHLASCPPYMRDGMPSMRLVRKLGHVLTRPALPRQDAAYPKLLSRCGRESRGRALFDGPSTRSAQRTELRNRANAKHCTVEFKHLEQVQAFHPLNGTDPTPSNAALPFPRSTHRSCPPPRPRLWPSPHIFRPDGPRSGGLARRAEWRTAAIA